MRQRLSMALRRTDDDRGCEFAEKAVVPEKLQIPNNFLLKHSFRSEYARVCRNPIDGLYVVPSAASDYRWYGVLFIRGGIFAGGIFRFTLHLQPDFPNTATLPEFIFDLSIFHPHINSKTRLLDLSRYFPDGWKKDKHHIQNVLLVSQRIFFSLEADLDSCANHEAAVLWKDSRQKFRELAKECVNRSRSHVYDDPSEDDLNAIRLTPWDSSVHDRCRNQMLGLVQMPSFRRNSHVGLSWVDPDRMTCMVEPLQKSCELKPVEVAQGAPFRTIERLDLSGISTESSPEISDERSGCTSSSSPLSPETAEDEEEEVTDC